MIRDLRRKFILINMMLVFLVLATTFTIFVATTYNRAKGESMDALHAALSRMMGQMPPKFYVGQNPPNGFRSPVFVLLVSRGETIVYSSADISASQESLDEIARLAMAIDDDIGVLPKHNLRFMKKDDHGGTKTAFIDMTEEKAALRISVLLSLGSLAMSLSAFFAISLFLSKWMLKPVEEAWQRQKRFVADASHELKTPLSVIMANLGILRASEGADAAKWIENTEVEAQRMKELVNSLLFLAKSDDAKKPADHYVLSLSDLAQSSALAFEAVAFERKISIETNIAPDVRVSGDEAQLRQLAGILLDNAAKYSFEETTVTVSLSAKQSKAVLTVHNLGEPLNPEDLDRVFDRFYRADKSRANEGYGLGLSIAQSVASLHNGKITASSSEQAGTSFVFTMPLSAQTGASLSPDS
ncbi:MAG: HAMP domain-containing histidine kinase [Clostridiales bacterium]|jgi:signal transduction histidine kinase|nr:HAMP domain-containing histidine kinase [Clostridiales bacterium]